MPGWNGSSPLARGTRGGAPDRGRRDRFIPARAGNTAPGPAISSRRSVHPRSRGEHPSSRPRASPSPGSSPLARGTPRGANRIRSGFRFIPARAGNTPRGARAPAPGAVHPRSRGEHGGIHSPASFDLGSSPLARGTQARQQRAFTAARFIPARAGNTDRGRPSPRGSSVHPRSRGEHLGLRDVAQPPGGSSPLARGTRSGEPRIIITCRFIPARAGNTPSRSTSPSRPPVHPRSRGEHEVDRGAGGHGGGSSPLARGTPCIGNDIARWRRFIPARAGNTPRTTSTPPTNSVHPRSRGEHLAGIWSRHVVDGSSPLARGNTRTARSPSSTRPVHPRSRGEHVRLGGGDDDDSGSSPLARGTRWTGRMGAVHDRFIPARAGNTWRPGCARWATTVHPRSRGEHNEVMGTEASGSGSSPLARGTQFAI